MFHKLAVRYFDVFYGKCSMYFKKCKAWIYLGYFTRKTTHESIYLTLLLHRVKSIRFFPKHKNGRCTERRV